METAYEHHHYTGRRETPAAGLTTHSLLERILGVGSLVRLLEDERFEKYMARYAWR